MEEAGPDLAFHVVVLYPLDEYSVCTLGSSVRLELVAGQMVMTSDDAVNLWEVISLDACDHVNVNIFARIVGHDLLANYAVPRLYGGQLLVVDQVVFDSLIAVDFFVLHPLDALVPSLPLLRL